MRFHNSCNILDESEETGRIVVRRRCGNVGCGLERGVIRRVNNKIARKSNALLCCYSVVAVAAASGYEGKGKVKQEQQQGDSCACVCVCIWRESEREIDDGLGRR